MKIPVLAERKSLNWSARRAAQGARAGEGKDYRTICFAGSSFRPGGREFGQPGGVGHDPGTLHQPLIKTGKQSSGWMVREDNCLLETHRLVANSSGIVDLVRTDNRDAMPAFFGFCGL